MGSGEPSQRLSARGKPNLQLSRENKSRISEDTSRLNTPQRMQNTYSRTRAPVPQGARHNQRIATTLSGTPKFSSIHRSGQGRKNSRKCDRELNYELTG